jgi:hypothetical protein
MAAGDRAKQKISQRAQAFIAAAPVPQEAVSAGVQVISGLSRGWTFLSPSARMFGRTYYLALTEHHLMFCWISAWTGRPREVTIIAPREQVRVTGSRLGGQMGWFTCVVPGREAPMTLRFYRLWRPEAEAIVAGLTTAP